MTSYELLDIRSQIDQFMLGIIRLWLTAMFASFAVAYSLGEALDAMSISVLLGFYAIIVLITMNSLQSSFKRMATLMTDADTPTSEASTHSPDKAAFGIPLPAKAGILSAMAGSYIILCIYLFQAVR